MGQRVFSLIAGVVFPLIALGICADLPSDGKWCSQVGLCPLQLVGRLCSSSLIWLTRVCD
jgi:hypothetical protein